MKKILITGESGTIPMQMQHNAHLYGLEVVNSQLIENSLTKHKKHQSFKVRKPELDFLDPKALETIPWNTLGAVIHSGAFVGTDFCSSDPNAAIRTNVEGTHNIVQYCNKYDIPLVYLSTTAILDPSCYDMNKPMSEGTPINPQTLYGITKYAGELLVKNVCKTDRIVVRPVFGFGNYPDDLHSALTKLIYVMYKNFTQHTDHKLTILLDPTIPKSYTRVENIATCILSFVEGNCNYLKDWCPVYNIGESYKIAKNWYQMFAIISHYFAQKGICNQTDFNKQVNEWIIFDREKDYLHYHNIDDSKIEDAGLSFNKFDNYIPLDIGIEKTINSVIENIEMEPYWL
jgi:dTDP-4-dehydrorhamnose reductase